MVDALVATLATVPQLAGKVYDGIPVTAEQIADGVFVGVVLDDDNGDAGKWAMDWHELGGTPPMDETGAVRCTVMAQRGDTDLATARASAFTHLGAVEAVCRGDYDLGVTDLLWLHVHSGRVRQGQTPRGSYCEIEFTVDYKALI